MRIFNVPTQPVVDQANLFASGRRFFVQMPDEAHDSKKVSGSSHGAMTYDTTAV
jgi:hypothetical protein